MTMPWGRFMMFYEYMIYITNMETEEGRKENKRLDNKLEYKKGITTIDSDIANLKNQLKGMK